MPNLWVGTQHDPADRLKLKVSPADFRAVRALPAGLTFTSVTVTDLVSGREYKLQRASCGLPGCNCAVELCPTQRRKRAR